MSKLHRIRRRTACSLAAAIAGLISNVAFSQAPDVNQLPAYKPEFKVQGSLRIAGSELKGNVDLLVEGFKKFHPDAVVSTNFQTSSEGALGMMYSGVSDVAPMGDDAKITDEMPFYNSYRYVPTEISIATGGYEKRGTLWPMAIIVNKDNPIAQLSMEQLDGIFGSERSGGWAIGEDETHNLLFTAKYTRGADKNIRTWGQLGLKGDWAGQQIHTHGYVAPGFIINFQRKVLHWSTKMNPNFMEYVEAKEAPDSAEGRAVNSDRMLEAVSRDKYAVAFGAMMHVDGSCVNPDGTKCVAYPNVKVVPLSPKAGAAAVALTADNVANRSYPLTRDAFVYVNKAPGRALDPKVREFLRFALSREGQAIIAKAGIYTPLPASYIAEQLKKLD
ncbi:PstS family phosphate ABC transporter substrate-binding protein [Rudaea sp.]|uniref:PstS family phosphate ABC transporter substrate-binding protein n=1 Tax=Rudaea sp. TaxID=2136325 RepID=UPI002ED18320